MSTRSGPHARAHAIDDRPGGTGNKSARAGLAGNAKALAQQEEVARADADYRRLRRAYREILHKEPDHAVALAMIGADLDRAYARLQALRARR